MKHAVSLMLCIALLAVSCALCVFAEEETTEATESVQQPLHVVFNGEVIGKQSIIQSSNHMNKGAGTISKTGEWQGIKIDVKSPEDPHVGLNYDNFIKKMGFEPQNIEDHPFIVLKVLADEIAFDDFEIYYCAGDQLNFDEAFRTASDYVQDAGNGELYFVFDLTDDATGALHSIRVDILGAEVDALMYLTEMAFFATEDEALEWCGYYDAPATDSSEQPTTEQPTTEQPEEESTEAETKKPAATTEAAKQEGCGSIVSVGVVVAMIALGTVCIKKKD